MIQRIQSLYLLLVAILMTVTIFSPLFTFGDGSDLYLFLGYGCAVIGTGLQDNAPLAVPIYGVASVAGLTALLALINIFFYKKRKTQIKLGYVIICCIVLFYVTTAVYFSSISDSFREVEFVSVRYGIALPVVALIITVLAILGIKKDERLIKSLDRIR